MKPGRPKHYLPFLAILQDDDLYSPATIVNYGRDCGLFLPHLVQVKNEDSQLRRKIRHTFSRFSKNHNFPTNGDGWTTQKIKGQNHTYGWTGRRWKQAAGLISATNENMNPFCEVLRFEQVSEMEKPDQLLERKALFLLEEVADILKFKPDCLASAVRTMMRGELCAWELTGLVPMMDGHWFLNMSVFAPFFRKCLEVNKAKPARWTAFSVLKVTGIESLGRVRHLLGDLRPQDIGYLTTEQRNILGIWWPRELGQFVVNKVTLANNCHQIAGWQRENDLQRVKRKGALRAGSRRAAVKPGIRAKKQKNLSDEQQV